MTKVAKIPLSITLGFALVASLVVALLMAGRAAAITPSSVEVTVTPNLAATVAEYTITFQHVATASTDTVISVTFPAGTVVPSSIATSSVLVGASSTRAGALATLTPAASTTVSAQTASVTLPALSGYGANQFIALRFTLAAGIRNPTMPGNYTLTVASSAPDEPSATSPPYAIIGIRDVAAAVTPNTAGDTADYTVTFQHGAPGAAGLVITVTFPSGTTVPSSIDTTRVLVGASTSTPEAALAAATVNPTVVTVTGRAVGVQLPSLPGFGAGQFIAVRFTQAAGIRNPAVSDDYRLTVASTAPGQPSATSPPYTINDVVEISPTHAPQGGTITVSGRGFSPGATIRVTGGPASGSGTVAADGTFSFTATRTGAAAAPVVVTDGTGRTASTAPTVLALDPSLIASPSSGKAQDRIRLRGINFGAGSNIPGPGSVTIAGTAMVAANVIPVNPGGFGALNPFVDLDGDGNNDDFDLDIRIPGNQLTGTYEVAVTDAAGNRATTNISVTGRSVSLTPTSGPPGTTVTVSGRNFPASVRADDANLVRAEVYLVGTVIGDPVRGLETDAAGNVSASFTIPQAATVGPITIRVRIVAPDNTNSDGTATFTVTARPLTVTPNSGPRGTEVTITGSGMTESGEIDPNNVVGNVAGARGNLLLQPGDLPLLATGQGIALDSGGNIPATTVRIPANAPLGAVTIRATDSGGRVAEATFTVTQPTIAINPTSGFMGTQVRITGSGWVPGRTVTINYAGTSVSAVPDGAGNIVAVATIPSGDIGPRDVTFNANDGATGNVAPTVVFRVNEASISVDPATAQAGSTVTIRGTGFRPGVGVRDLKIGGASVLPLEPIVTDSLGAFRASVRVPLGLTGTQAVEANVGGVERSTSLVVTAAAETVATQLSSISTQLVRVWGYDAAAQAWRVYDPAAPTLSDLPVLVRGQGYWVNVNADVTLVFGGNEYRLRRGWNLIGWLGS